MQARNLSFTRTWSRLAGQLTAAGMGVLAHGRRRALFLAAFALAGLTPQLAGAVQFDVDMINQGYSLQAKSRIIGIFNGCKVGASFSLEDGTVLHCMSYHYFYGNGPDVTVWWNSQLNEQVVEVGSEKIDAYVSRPGVEDRGAIGTPNPLAPPPSQGAAASKF